MKSCKTFLKCLKFVYLINSKWFTSKIFKLIYQMIISCGLSIAKDFLVLFTDIGDP